MDLKENLSKIFKSLSDMDEDLYYHYMIEEINNKLIIDGQNENVDANSIGRIGVDNKLILSCNDENELAVIWYKDAKETMCINYIRVDNVKHRIQKNSNGEKVEEEVIEFYSKDLPGRLLIIKLVPNICIEIKVN